MTQPGPSRSGAPRPRPSAIRRRRLRLDDLAQIAAVHDPAISPDGARVAVVVQRVDERANVVRGRLLVLDVDRPGRRRTVATGLGKLGAPRWSPDGGRLAYVTDRGAKKGQLAVVAIHPDGSPAGTAVRLTDVPAGASAPAWSPDGLWIAFVAGGAEHAGDPVPRIEKDERRRVIRSRGHRHKVEGLGYLEPGGPRPHIWIVAAGGGAVRQLTDGGYEDAEPAWSPDGATIAFVSDRSAGRDGHFGGGAIHLVEAATGKVRRLTSENLSSALPAWSPDGARIAYLRSDAPSEVDGRTERLWVADVATGREECWTAGVDRAVGFRPGGYRTPSPPAWAPDGRSVLTLLADAGTTQLVRIGPGVEPVTWLTRGRHVVQEVSVASHGRRAVLLGTDAVTPSELWLWEEGRPATRLTGFNDSLLRRVVIRQPEPRRIVRPDGFTIHGWLTKPGRRRPAPLVLMVHGGPHNAYGDTFNGDVQLWAGAGYAVLQVNPRGSGSYGETFARAVLRDWGGADWEDIVAVLDAVLDDPRSGVDRRQTAIMGGSYGGFMTCWAITQTNRFSVAAAGAPLTNLESEYGTADIGPTWFAEEIGGTPNTAQERFRARSALPLADRVTTPLLLYHGEADLRVPIEQSEQFLTALTALGREVELLRVPGEGHVLPGDASPVHRRLVREEIGAWFARYLGPGPTEPTSA